MRLRGQLIQNHKTPYVFNRGQTRDNHHW